MSVSIVYSGPVCPVCGEPLGRRLCIGDKHHTCAMIRQRLATLAHNLAAAAFGERMFRLGADHGSWREDPYPDAEPWRPGTGHSADHECIDCGAPMLTDDVAQGFRTCELCARERREAR